MRSAHATDTAACRHLEAQYEEITEMRDRTAERPHPKGKNADAASKRAGPLAR